MGYQLSILTDGTTKIIYLHNTLKTIEKEISEIKEFFFQKEIFEYPGSICTKTPSEQEMFYWLNNHGLIYPLPVILPSAPPEEILVHGETYVRKEKEKKPIFCGRVCLECPYLENSIKSIALNKKLYPNNTILYCTKYKRDVSDIGANGLIIRCRECRDEFSTDS
jgi:hypothetical protein